MRAARWALAGLLVPAALASADTINIAGDGALGDFTGSLDLTGSILTVTLTNTSPAANGGFLTGFVFNGRDGATATFDVAASSANVASFQDVAPTEDAPPFGTFEFGAALGGDWTGGGSPNDGLGVGDTGTFVFNTTGADTVEDFFSDFGVLKEAKNGDPAEYSDVVFAVRFKGFEDEGSDKVPGTETPPPPVVPLPPAVLGGLGLLGVLAARRVRRGATA
jgi:hypothetical protein